MNTKNTAFIIVLGVVVIGVAYIQGWITPKDSSDSEQQSTDLTSPPAETGIVKRIIDPITIELESGHIIRYIGVRTPNVDQEVQCFGKEALLANESIIGRNVRLEEEPLLTRSSDGAWTRYVFFTPEVNTSDEQAVTPTPDIAPDLSTVTEDAQEILSQVGGNQEQAEDPEETTSPSEESEPKDIAESDSPEVDEIFVNERILEGGFGFPVVSQDMVYGERMLSAARFASATGKGLWGKCEISDEPQLTTQTLESCTIKGKISADGSKLYRSQECPAYGQTMVIQSEGGQWFCAEDIAEDAGFTKAPDCP